jgi:uncharacterized protein
MPVQPGVSYPGVYIQEVESDVHTIVPVDTATTAFIGCALRGPVNQPVVIHSFADFQRIFGGLWLESRLGYAVNQFFLNGGSKAVIVRLYHPPAAADAGEEPDEEGEAGTTNTEAGEEPGEKEKPQPANPDAGKAKVPIPGLNLKPKNPGAWGNQLCVRVTDPDPKIEDQLAKKYEVEKEQLFNLTVHDLKTGLTEYFADLTVVEGPRRIDRVLEKESQLIAVEEELPEERPQAHAALNGAKKMWADEAAYTKVTVSGSDGEGLSPADLLGDEAQKSGIYALEHADIFNLLYIPPYTEEGVDSNVLAAAAAYCEKRRAFLLVDPPSDWTGKDKARDGFPIDGLSSSNAAVFFPRIQLANPLRDNQVEEYGPCGAVAGIFARTDATRGVWKAPAGISATLKGVLGLTVPLTDAENGELNPLGINCLRQMPAAGYVVWGARTLLGDDRLANQWKYIPVRRTALYIEESLYRGTQWAVFEPNDEPLWSKLRLNIGVFMHNLFRQGAFQGGSPGEAYFVKCDKTTTTQADIDRGIVNIMVGFAPLKPAEFVIMYIQQKAGELAA